MTNTSENATVNDINEHIHIDKDADNLKITLAQSTFNVGDIEANCAKIVSQSLKAKESGTDIIVFPELCLVGYPPKDLLQKNSLNQRIQDAFKHLAKVKDILIIIGYPHVDHNGVFNSVGLFLNGKQRGFYHKQNLHGYKNSAGFSELNYFQTGKNHVSFDYKGQKIGLLIGHDLAIKEPMQALKKVNVDFVISLNASAFLTNQQQYRKDMLSARVQETGLPILYVNTIGGQDELVFDGGSMAMNADGSIPVECNRFIEIQTTVNFDGKQFAKQPEPFTLTEDAQNYYALVIGLRDYVRNSGFKSVLLGLSGGVDSALTLCIAVDALGADNVYSVMMPSEHTAPMSLEDAETLATALNVSYNIMPIHQAYQGMMQTLAPFFADVPVDNTEENLQARIRSTMLMSLSNKFGHMLVSSSNKTDLSVGHTSLYGSMCGGYSVLKDVYKTQIYKLAQYRNNEGKISVIPERILKRPPTAELKANQLDTNKLPEYAILDKILGLYIDEQKSYDEIIQAGFDKEIVNYLLPLIDGSEYKRRQVPVGACISSSAFEHREYPVVNHWLSQLK